MIATPDLIDSLVAELHPVRRLYPPLLRALFWLAAAAAIFAALASTRGLRPDLPQHLAHLRFLFGIAGALSTGVLAALAAMMLSLPDRSPFWLFAPAPGLILWLSAIGSQCLTHWVTIGPGGVRLGETAACFATLLLVSVPLSLVMRLLLRRAALLRPGETIFSGSLAVAAMTAAALSLFHPLDATLMILIWNLGGAALVFAAGGLLGWRTGLSLPPHPSSRESRL